MATIYFWITGPCKNHEIKKISSSTIKKKISREKVKRRIKSFSTRLCLSKVTSREESLEFILFSQCTENFLKKWENVSPKIFLRRDRFIAQ